MPMPLISCKDFESSCCDSHSTTYVLLFMATCVLRALNTINYIWRDSWMKWWFTTSFTICKRDRWMKWWFTTSFTICNFHLPVQLSNGKWLSVQQETKALLCQWLFPFGCWVQSNLMKWKEAWIVFRNCQTEAFRVGFFVWNSHFCFQNFSRWK